ncbi:MAG TPA: CBS domain-containing protein [Jiangellaceae bacterium]|nr:CBS domain-containing protein [Jiangellaceae bacterium]
MKGHWTVADVMTTDVVTVRATTTFKDIARQIAERRVSAVPVVDGEGQVLGVVSETDLLRKEEYLVPWRSRRLAHRGSRAERAKALGTVAAELMTAPAVCVTMGASLPMAARLMTDHDVTRLVVLNSDGRLAGIVSRSDLLRVYLTPDEQLRERVVRRLIQNALWDDPFAVRAEVEDGVVTLTGELERRSLVPIAVQFARTVDGVVDVRNKLTYLADDTDFTMIRT